MISNDGGSLAAQIVQLISQDGSGLVAKNLANLISQDGSGLVLGATNSLLNGLTNGAPLISSSTSMISSGSSFSLLDISTKPKNAKH